MDENYPKIIRFEDAFIHFLDQRRLPGEEVIYSARTVEEVTFAIKEMVIRGAPAIGIAGVFGMSQAVMTRRDLREAAQIIKASRPTAYDLFFGVDWFLEQEPRLKEVSSREIAMEYYHMIVDKCRRIGEYGSTLIKDKAKILTHCNAGALAVAEYGTALAPMFVAQEKGKDIFVYVDETRPRLQGARLTAYELAKAKIPHRLIPDNAAGYYLAKGEVDLVIVGTDRVAANGDFANKIGTYEKAVVAKENNVPFYVAAPCSTIDFSLETGEKIPIEFRSEDEVLVINDERIAPLETKAENPAFDVTPAKFVTGFITEKGIFGPGELSALRKNGN